MWPLNVIVVEEMQQLLEDWYWRAMSGRIRIAIKDGAVVVRIANEGM